MQYGPRGSYFVLYYPTAVSCAKDIAIDHGEWLFRLGATCSTSIKQASFYEDARLRAPSPEQEHCSNVAGQEASWMTMCTEQCTSHTTLTNREDVHL
eukprot:1148692-Pelagomonas_calceolata.AAC.3